MSAKPASLTLFLTAFLAMATASCSKPGDAGAGSASKDAPSAEARKIEIAVTGSGYSPSTIEAKKGESLVLRFTRTVKGECLSQVVFPEQKITRDLPMNTPVEVALKADKAGKIPFQCGMAMVHGAVNVTGS